MNMNTTNEGAGGYVGVAMRKLPAMADLTAHMDRATRRRWRELETRANKGRVLNMMHKTGARGVAVATGNASHACEPEAN